MNDLHSAPRDPEWVRQPGALVPLLKLILGVMSVVGCTVCANLFLKVGAVAPPSEKFLLGMFGWKSLLGLGFFATAGLLYAWVLRWIPLHVAQGIAAAQFMCVVLAARVILSEPINNAQWLGIVLIASGLVVSVWAYRPA